MNREIKFRGREGCNSWVYGPACRIIKSETPYACIYTPKWIAWRVDIFTLGEYSGLNASDGTEIFEDDLILVSYPKDAPDDDMTGLYPEPTVYTVVFTKGAFYCKSEKDYLLTLMGDFYSEECIFEVLPTIKVLGNIHDTQALEEEGYE